MQSHYASAVQHVEELVRLHDSTFSPSTLPLTAAATRTTKMPLARHVFRHCERAARTALAVALTCAVAIHAPHEFSALSAIFAILCVDGTLGATVRCCVEATLAALATIPLGWLALVGALPAADAYASRVVLSLSCLAAFNLLCNTVAELPSVARKVLAGTSSVGVLLSLRSPLAGPPAALLGIA